MPVQACKAGVAAAGEFAVRVALDPEDRGLRDHGPAHPEIVLGVQDAAFGQVVGVCEQPVPPGVPLVRGVGNLVGEQGHAVVVLEPALTVGLQDAAVRARELIQGHQGAGGVQHVRGHGLAGVGVAHRVAQHHGQLRPVPDLEHAHRVAGAQGRSLGREVGGGLHHEGSRGQHAAPPFQGGARGLVVAPGEQLADVRVRAHQDHEAGLPVRRGPVDVAGQLRGGETDRVALVPVVGAVRGGDHAAQGGVAGPGVVSRGQHHHAPEHPGRQRATSLPAAGARHARTARAEQREVHPQHGREAVLPARQDVLDRAVETVPVRAREDLRPLLRCGGRQLLRARHTVVGAEGGGHVEMREVHGRIRIFIRILVKCCGSWCSTSGPLHRPLTQGSPRAAATGPRPGCARAGRCRARPPRPAAPEPATAPGPPC